MTNDSTAKEAQKMALQLRAEYRALIKNGLDQTQTTKEANKSLEILDSDIEDIFLLYAKVKMARALGVENYFAAETGDVVMPDSYGSAD